MENTGRKVAVVGMGGIFPTCSSLDDFSNKIFKNESLIRTWDLATSYGNQIRSHVAGYVTEDEVNLETIYSSIVEGYPEVYVDRLNRIPPKNLATADIGSIWAMLSSLEAIKMSGWSTIDTQSERTGVSIGSGGVGTEILRPAWNGFFEKGLKSRATGPHTVDRAMMYRDAANVSCLIQNKGICESIGSACATGLGNIGYAYRMIKFGVQDRMVTGGVEGTSFASMIGFDAMQVLSRGFAPHESSRPFDLNRNGFVCSFGAGIVCLEAYETAKARGASILGVIDHYFNNSDGDGDMFSPSFDGQKRLWTGLMQNGPEIPDVVKVHGTSTPVGDALELLSIVDTLGTKGYHISAPKSQFGHMLGAAGAVEFITALLMLKKQMVAPCLNSNNLNVEQEHFQKTNNWRGPVSPISAYRHLLPKTALAKEINTIACLNYGFGGTNSGMIVSKDNA